jgi:chromosome partitioning protein
MKKIVFFNTKGGTGKTTICYNYGWYLAKKRKKKVLFMDLDPQVNLVQSFGLGTSNNMGKNLDRLITDYVRDRKTIFKNYIIKVNNRIDLLPSSNNISLVEEYITDDIMKKSRESAGKLKSNQRNIILRSLFEKTIDRLDYDFVLIDSQPNFSLLSSASLIYAKNVIVVSRPDLFSFLDIDYLKKIINNLNKKYYTNIKVNSILINAFEKRRKTSKEGVMNLIDKYGGEFNILQNKIRYLSAFQTSISEERKPVFLSYPRSEAAKNIIRTFSELDDNVNKIYGI